MIQPLISVITPTLNQAFSLRETIESVLSQTYRNFEYLIVDGGSTDGTLNILKEYNGAPNLKWISEKDTGQSKAINKGLALSRGDLFNWINSDDLLERDALKQLAKTSLAQPKAEVISGITGEFHHGTEIIFKQSSLQVRSSPEETATVGVFSQPGTFWRTEVVRKLHGLREHLHYAMDYDLWLRYLLTRAQSEVVVIDVPFARYRHHPQSKTTLYSSGFYRETAEIFDEFNAQMRAPACFFKGLSERNGDHQLPAEIHPSFCPDRYLGFFCERQVRIQRDSNPREARQWLRRAFSYRPWITFWRLKMMIRLTVEFISSRMNWSARKTAKQRII
jgi:glycosyltransferase involved in cell wall biosynthesis